MPAGRLLGCLSIPSSVDQRKRTRGTKRVSQIDVLTFKCWRYGCEWETTNPSWLKCRPDIHRTFALPPKVWYESHNRLPCLLSMFGLACTTHRWCLLGTLWFDLVKEKTCVPSFTDLVSHFQQLHLDHLLVSCHTMSLLAQTQLRFPFYLCKLSSALPSLWSLAPPSCAPLRSQTFVPNAEIYVRDTLKSVQIVLWTGRLATKHRRGDR